MEKGLKIGCAAGRKSLGVSGCGVSVSKATTKSQQGKSNREVTKGIKGRREERITEKPAG